jgi:hypothetical protein
MRVTHEDGATKRACIFSVRAVFYSRAGMDCALPDRPDA